MRRTTVEEYGSGRGMLRRAAVVQGRNAGRGGCSQYGMEARLRRRCGMKVTKNRLN